jgi:hypothetical protein
MRSQSVKPLKMLVKPRLNKSSKLNIMICGGRIDGVHGMRDDDSSDPEQAGPDLVKSVNPTAPGDDLFGVFSVHSPGVHIMLDGRPVTTRLR